VLWSGWDTMKVLLAMLALGGVLFTVNHIRRGGLFTVNHI
jgi:hypothetical protein